MEAPGHIGVALLVYLPIAARFLAAGDWRRVRRGAVVVGAVALLPDVDLYVAALTHRGLSHTVWAALLVGVLLGVAVAATTPADRRRWRTGVEAGLLGALAITSHLLGDVLTPMGIRPVAPLETTTLTLSLTPAADPTANAVLLLSGVVAFSGVLALGGRVDPSAPTVDAGQKDDARVLGPVSTSGRDDG